MKDVFYTMFATFGIDIQKTKINAIIFAFLKLLDFILWQYANCKIVSLVVTLKDMHVQVIVLIALFSDTVIRNEMGRQP